MVLASFLNKESSVGIWKPPSIETSVRVLARRGAFGGSVGAQVVATRARRRMAVVVAMAAVARRACVQALTLLVCVLARCGVAASAVAADELRHQELSKRLSCTHSRCTGAAQQALEVAARDLKLIVRVPARFWTRAWMVFLV